MHPISQMLTGHPPYFQNNPRLASLSDREVFQWLTTPQNRRLLPALPAPGLISAHCANFITLCLQYDPIVRPQSDDRIMRVHPFRLGLPEDAVTPGMGLSMGGTGSQGLTSGGRASGGTWSAQTQMAGTTAGNSGADGAPL